MKKKLFPQNKKLTWRLIYYKKSDLVELIHMFFLYAFWLGVFPFILVNRILVTHAVLQLGNAIRTGILPRGG